MQSYLKELPTATLAAAVLAIDALLWTAVLPFEFFARQANAAAHPSPVLLVMVLVVNAFFLACMGAASAATMELVRRGVTLRRLLPVRILTPRSEE